MPGAFFSIWRVSPGDVQSPVIVSFLVLIRYYRALALPARDGLPIPGVDSAEQVEPLEKKIIDKIL